jgi:general secretion pathway protein C
VVIAYDGRLESLSLPQPGTSILAANMHFGNSSSNGSGVRIAPRPRQSGLPFSFQLRQQIEKQPQTLSHYLRMRPYSANGKLEGYRVYPGSQPELFERSGLQPGDVITRINGIALDSGLGTMKAMAQLRHMQGTVQLNVRRHGQPVHLTLHLPGG